MQTISKKLMSIDKIICVGKNYLDHAKELGDEVPKKPVLFLKPASVLRQISCWGEQLQATFPADPEVQPECEIVLRIAHDGYKMTIEDTREAIADITLGLDMTLRTRQTNLKRKGYPWTTSKVFKDAAILGPWIAYEHFSDYMEAEFQLHLDGILRQQAKGIDMMMYPEDLLVYISNFFPLKAGDIIYTGTPAGVTSISENTIAKLCWNNYFYTVKWR
ncbi:2-keto-4-pentenoate hydratase/2-oxohepta-3-ene-1,7-dioic acid hydratase (catechol pathway) [Legionella beliardensis]|uniref:2-keto-4-pentenoate hydratase/2-oxohepta-3-ene-1,7-dioic acid hydratase (Catechol pathway) n=2 Tax=Legionella beliardensis TaxID=91822 RepID=A0A378JPW4_9GAMM|nr:fumarylacetoacetate hydrolase family protein [Legionella beliardensis]STX55646.1 2-keto-4-pentenoate hydratase/2-oxohepta-3-ene-1,7-dioic acid hydratase (catechol pathway) [Legionella beliardensis]